MLRVASPGCPFPSPAGTPFHAVCAFRGLGPVALRVHAARLLRVYARLCSRNVPVSPLPPRVCVSRALHAVLVQGAGRAFPGGLCPFAFAAPVPCCVYLALGGGGSAPSSPCLAWGRSPPRGQACFCDLAWPAVGAARGRPGGAPLAWVWGARRWALSNAQPSVLGAFGRGLLPTGCWCEGVGLGTRHQPHSARSCELALSVMVRHKGARGWGVFCLGVGRPGLVAHPRPTARPPGVRPGPATDWLWVRGV